MQTVVHKRRGVYIAYDNVRVHLDDVAGLGTFLEIEAVYAHEAEAEAEHQKVRELMDRLGIQTADLVSGSYRDLLPSQP